MFQLVYARGKNRASFSFATVINYKEMFSLVIVSTCELTASQLSMETHVPNVHDQIEMYWL